MRAAAPMLQSVRPHCETIAMPERAQIPENIREQLIVELYSK